MKLNYATWFMVLLAVQVSYSYAQDDGEDDDYNVGLAFALVTGAGLSTTFGAALVFYDSLIIQNNRRVLGAALGFAGGVMLYVSFFEILQESITEFSECECLWNADDLEEDEKDGAAILMGTIFFGVGIIITYILDVFVHWLFHQSDAGHDYASFIAESQLPGAEAKKVKTQIESLPNQIDRNSRVVVEAKPTSKASAVSVPAAGAENVATPNPLASHELGSRVEEGGSKAADGEEAEGEVDVEIDDERRELHRMGILTAVAIALHNFPEGLATLAGTLSDESVGIALAVAIAIHNIPEGLCVAIPIYYATGSRVRGFWWAFWSGVTEIIGAAIGYAFLEAVLGPAAFGVLLGIVAGMMITIVIKELLPTAHKYDPNDDVATTAVMIGMGVMALSIVLFDI